MCLKVKHSIFIVAIVAAIGLIGSACDEESPRTDHDGAAPDTSLATDGPGSQGDQGGQDGPTTVDGPATKPDGSKPSTYSCTHVIGYSQVNQWYTTGGVFESVVDNSRWQLRWNSGAGVDLWQNPSYAGWSKPIVSPCAVDSGAPDRVLLSISGPYGSDETAWANAIKATVAVIRTKHPSAKVIILQPVVGGPNHQTCTNGGKDVRASWQHKHIDNAIAKVVGNDVVAGASPEVQSCSDYKDSLGHLTDAGAKAAGQSIGTFYLTF